MEISDENIERKTVEKEKFVWTCPKCGKKIPGPSEKKVKTNARQHDTVKH